MKQRVLTAFLILPFAMAMLLYLPTIITAAICAVFCLIAMWEWTRLSGMHSRPWRGIIVALLAVAMICLWFYGNVPLWWLLIVVGCAWWIAAIFWLRRFSFAASPAREYIVLKVVVGVLVILPAWAAMVRLQLTQATPHTWSLYALGIIWAADSAAYVAGRQWGKTKLAPQISPGKTWAGFYGALAGCALTAAIAGWWMLDVRGAMLVALIFVALISASFSVIGDLFESLIKRHAGAKDSGAMFPGHGGVCDRLDGVFAALPFFALGKALLGL